jgi:hypothetical protein
MNEAVLKKISQDLAIKNYSITHIRELLSPDEWRAWHRSEEFVNEFANSKEYSVFESAFLADLVESSAFKKEHEERINTLAESVEVSKADVAEAKKFLLKLQVEGATNGQLLEAKNGYQDAVNKSRTRAIELKEARTSLAVELAKMRKSFKPYVFNEVHWRGVRLNAKDPSVLFTASSSFLQIASAYYGEKVKVRIPILWRVCPFTEAGEVPERMGSQLWHRDQTDHKILKLFVYYSDVDKDAGALEYIPNSLPVGSEWSDALPLKENTGYIPQKLIDETVPSSSIVECCGEKGTLVFADTAGLHRGGYAINKTRITTQATYLRYNPKVPQPPLMTKECLSYDFTEEQFEALS